MRACAYPSRKKRVNSTYFHLRARVGATAGWSWEAGIVTLDKKTVELIKDSITNLNLDPVRARAPS